MPASDSGFLLVDIFPEEGITLALRWPSLLNVMLECAANGRQAWPVNPVSLESFLALSDTFGAASQILT